MRKRDPKGGAHDACGGVFIRLRAERNAADAAIRRVASLQSGYSECRLFLNNPTLLFLVVPPCKLGIANAACSSIIDKVEEKTDGGNAMNTYHTLSVFAFAVCANAL